MSPQPARFELLTEDPEQAIIALSGDWSQGHAHREFSVLQDELVGISARHLVADGASLGEWDSLLMAFLLQCSEACREDGLVFSTRAMPEGVAVEK